MSVDSPEAGWYPDARRSLRWWDGNAWGKKFPKGPNKFGIAIAILVGLAFLSAAAVGIVAAVNALSHAIAASDKPNASVINDTGQSVAISICYDDACTDSDSRAVLAPGESFSLRVYTFTVTQLAVEAPPGGATECKAMVVVNLPVQPYSLRSLPSCQFVSDDS